MKLKIGANASDKRLHFWRLSSTRRDQNLRQGRHTLDLRVAAALERIAEWRLALAIEDVDACTMPKQ